jgi:hypothetical protein
MVKEIKVTIRGFKYTLKSQSYRAMFLFEDITGKPIEEVNTLRDRITYIYCILKVSNKDFDFSLEDFFDILDADDSILISFTEMASVKKK